MALIVERQPAGHRRGGRQRHRRRARLRRGQVGFTDTQATGTDVEFDPDAAPVITPIDNQGNTPGVLQFNGGSDGVTVPHSSSLAVNRTLTLETWLRVDSFANDWMPVVQKGTGSGTNSRSFSLWVNENGYLHFTSSSASTAIQSAANTPAGSIELGRWYHFAGVLDRRSGRMEVYLDGQLVNIAYTSVPNLDTVSHTSPLLFGRTLETSNYYSPFVGPTGRSAAVEHGPPAGRHRARHDPHAAGGHAGPGRLLAVQRAAGLSRSRTPPATATTAGCKAPSSRQLAPIHVGVTDSKTDRLWIEATSSDPDVSVTVDGDQLYVCAARRLPGHGPDHRHRLGQHRRAWDGRGRSATTSFDITFGDQRHLRHGVRRCQRRRPARPGRRAAGRRPAVPRSQRRRPARPATPSRSPTPTPTATTSSAACRSSTRCPTARPS